METIGLVFIFSKCLDLARLNKTFNTIVLTLGQAGNNMMVFLVVLVFFNIMLIPLAQSIWGTKLKGYKTIADTRNSIMMIAYSKGNYDVLLDINPLWSMLFVIFYYFIAIFILHAAFHMV